jgi:DNA-directed RNA polymerase subunit RPC12/RpoP
MSDTTSEIHCRACKRLLVMFRLNKGGRTMDVPKGKNLAFHRTIFGGIKVECPHCGVMTKMDPTLLQAAVLAAP